ncbi:MULTISPECIES: PEPxxWA-CTERM sorting domain-containing protein [unclassified Phenylobacterium]|uniref:PEPxxWA-CTERM sorting domain-containing protein n=1 Tax=unclassified Phenylobacterium TaxID=2640670 RepID=UPI00083B409F|nr:MULTISPECIES: PEPxxWA-CTERM sorting domain-containing protein [unclassified Phenylobacterium]
MKMHSAGKFALALSAVTVMAATPALAKNDKNKDKGPPPPSGGTTFVPVSCEAAGVQLGALDCSGWLQDNLNVDGLGVGTLDKRTARTDALNDLAGGSVFDAATLVPLAKYNTSGPTIDFGQTLYGITLVGFHVGGANGAGGIGYSGTAFFKFDAGAGMDSFTFNMPGLSNAALYSTGVAVPEPATWAMMIMGFGAAGALLRRRRRALA